MMPNIDKRGYRLNVGIIIINNQGQLFWARRATIDGAWQFPQGGINMGEGAKQAMYRELYEEVGLQPMDVELIAESRRWLYYRLPERFIRHHVLPLCIGQKQRWFLLKLTASEEKINFLMTDKPEFDDWQWVSYCYPITHIIAFKRRVYREALKEFKHHVLEGGCKP